MTVLQQMSVAVEAFCIVICGVLLIYLFLDRRTPNATGPNFFGMVVSTLLMCVSDILDDLFTGSAWAGAGALLWASSVIYFVSSAALMVFYIGYISVYSEKHGGCPGRICFRVGLGLAGAVAFLSLITVPTHLVFYISPDNVYRRGVLFVPFQVLSFLTYVVGWHLLVRCRKVFSRRAMIFFVSFSLLPLTAQAVQNVFPQYSLIPPAMTVALLLVFVFIQFELKLENEQHKLALQQTELEHMERQHQLQSELTEQTIVALSNAVEAKDRYTNGHSRRVAEYAREIARRAGRSEQQQQQIYYAGLLHDVGKIRVPDTIINKTEGLSPREFEEIRLHAMAGYYILKEISSISAFAVAARWHHERYDGKGYPNGLSGENIPEIARIIGVADTYDAMTSNRSYRNIMPQADARREIAAGLGTQFDPVFAQIMLDMIDEDTEYQMRQPERNTRLNILAVDDDPMILSFLSSTLGDALGYHLTAVSNVRRGLELIRKKKPDLVLLDVEMPELNGFEMLARIRKEHGKIPTIFMTGDRELSIIQKAEEAGASDYLTKPLTTRILLESIQNVMYGGKKV